MFPTLNYLLNYVFGTTFSLEFPPSFGAMVALAFLSAAWVLGQELKRKEQLGLVKPFPVKQRIGEGPNTLDLALQGLTGFFIGFKLLGFVTEAELFKADPQGYILSFQGNWIAGLAVGAVFAWLRYREVKRKQLPTPEDKIVQLRPYEMVGQITMYAAIFGILGAKVFHNLEYPAEFFRDPIGSFFSTSGLTFYGGLIGGFLGVWYIARKRKFALIHLADAAAPGLILAYAVGRMGCFLSGDGDWGIVNSAYRIDENRKYSLVPAEQFKTDLAATGYYYYFDSETPEGVDHAYFPKPGALSFLPDWMFAFDFPHNVNRQGIDIQNCPPHMTYCKRLPLPVFPTMMYEILMGAVIFLGLWLFRNRLKVAGQMFFMYLIMNGLERLLIEQIRVNAEFRLLGMNLTQAELIAFTLIGLGTTGVFMAKKWESKLLKW